VTGEARRAMAARRGSWPDDVARRVVVWLVWWALLMAFWVILDYSTERNELLAGAAAAALGAFLAELVTYQAAARFRLRARWLLHSRAR
jgi:hypothetical protein